MESEHSTKHLPVKYLQSSYEAFLLLYLSSSMARNLLWVGTQLIKRISCCSGTWKPVNYMWNRQCHSTWTALFNVATCLSCFLPHHFAFRAKVLSIFQPHYVGQTEHWPFYSSPLSCPLCVPHEHPSWHPLCCRLNNSLNGAFSYCSNYHGDAKFCVLRGILKFVSRNISCTSIHSL